jgi:hypothetical protein
MPQKFELMNAGAPAMLAHMLGHDALVTVASAGASQATATPLNGNFAIISGTGGVLLPPAGGAALTVIFPTGAATVYPNGTDAINNGAAGVGLAMTANRAQLLVPCGKTWIALGSAN